MPTLSYRHLSVVVVAGMACLSTVACASASSEDEGAESSLAAASALTSQDVVLHAGTATTRTGWNVVSDTTAASSVRMHNPNAGVAKIGTASATPGAYFEMTFNATAGTSYHLWLRLKADNDDYANDSVHVQFSDSVDASGNATSRIGTTSSQAVVLEQCDGAGRHGWGWSDNGWCGNGPSIRFATTGSHTIRVQQREDGVSIDQIVLSPVTYASASPGAAKDDTTRLAAQNGSTTPPPPPPPAPASMKVLTWNTEGPLGTADIDLVAAQNPQVVFLQELDTVQMAENLRLRLQSLQGGTWDKAVYTRGTDTSSSYVAIVSKYPLSNKGMVILRQPGTYVVSCYSSSAVFHPGRAAVGGTITVNGRTMSVFATRMTSSSDRTCLRTEENRILKNWANANYPGPHIYGGDFNTSPGSSPYNTFLNDPYPTTDSWALAVNEGTATAPSGTSATFTTPTRSSRIDYVFFDRATPYLDVVSSQIVDQQSLSDHRLMMTTFNVQ
jgi:endonuclease/exonuclease/phosphatase family metal-dependent hydrolase